MSLLKARCPPTVFWVVAFIIIATINGQLRRWIAHVRVEIIKIKPCIANGYAATTVVFPSLVIRIRAALHHARPDSVGFSPVMLFRLPMSLAFQWNQTSETTTRFGVSSSQVSAANRNRLTAVALAQPKKPSVGRFAVKFKNNEFSETLAYHGGLTC
jgi:hypothetical protein